MKILSFPYEMIISYFDIKIGPIVLIKFGIGVPEKGIGIPENEIANLMDFHTKGDTFSHCYVQHDNTVSLNHCFALEDKKTRGGCYNLMISVLFKKQTNITKKEYLNNILNNIDILELWIEGISEQVSREKNINSILNSPNTASLHKYNEIKSSLIRCLNRNVLSTSKLN